MNARFEKLLLGALLVLAGAATSWAGPTNLSTGGAPVVTDSVMTDQAAKSNTKSDDRCAQRVSQAKKISALRAALAMWAACSGKKMNLQNLEHLQAVDIPVIQGSSTSPARLEVQLCSLSRPLVGCPSNEKSVVAGALPLITPPALAPVAPVLPVQNPGKVDDAVKEAPAPIDDSLTCKLELSIVPSNMTAGVQPMAFRIKHDSPADCLTPSGTVWFMETKVGPSSCQVIDGPMKMNNEIIFKIRFDPPTNSDYAACNYVAFKNSPNEIAGQLTPFVTFSK